EMTLYFLVQNRRRAGSSSHPKCYTTLRSQTPKPKPPPRPAAFLLLSPKQHQAYQDILAMARRHLFLPEESALTVTEEQFKKLYRRLVKRLHPDRHPGASPERLDAITGEFRKLRALYEVILPAVGKRRQ